MATAGEVLENRISGQRLIFRRTAADTGGELLEVESVYTKPSPSRPPAHYHPYQEERFEVLSGRVNVVVGGEERALEEGEVLTIPPGTPHEMWAEEAGARVAWQTRPAMKTEVFFEKIWGLANAGKTNERGVPNILLAAVIVREHSDEFRLASPPWPAQRALFAVLAPFSRLLGYGDENAGLEWLASAVLAVTGTTLFGHFEERTPKWRRLSKWAFYFGVTALLSRGPGRPWTFAWVFGLPGVGLAFHFWWCKKHDINPLTAEPKERYYELRGWGRP